MTAHSTLLRLVQDRIDARLDLETGHLARISPAAGALVNETRQLMTGGKRLRSQFCYWGWRAAERDVPDDRSRRQLDAVLQLAAAIEMFHAAALVHDDVIDHSFTRRGHPATHVAFARRHEAAGWRGDAAAFGEAAAIVLGDLLLDWSHQMFADGLAAVPGDAERAASRSLVSAMTSEVMVGQYLDILGEHAWPVLPDDTALERAETVMLYKSAKYSIEQPTLLGAAVAGADEPLLATLSAFGVHAGLAFQLRDDILGVFGDPDRTGKPAGDDLREGKRTVLIALTRSRVSTTVAHVLDDMLGDPDLTDDQVRILQQTIIDSGALQATEELIDDHTRRALAALADPRIAPGARHELADLADRAARRAR